MKQRKYLIIALITILELFSIKVQSQTLGGCDLCGPSVGSNKNMASGIYSATIGAGCESQGAYSLAVGLIAKSYSPNAIAMGKYVSAKAANSVVIGAGTSNIESRKLINIIPNSLMIGFNSCVPTLFVSNSSGYNKSGKVGIGNVTIPKAKLHVKSDFNEDAGVVLETSASTNSSFIQFQNESNVISFKKDVGMSLLSQGTNINLTAKNVLMNAKVTINATPDFAEGYDQTLAVSGGILTTGVIVKEVSEWYDFVFEEDYNLMPINEVERFITDNGHLPDIPSESVVLDDGYDMVEMDGLLLKKIEELTLYTIELNKQIEEQQNLIEFLQSK